LNRMIDFRALLLTVAAVLAGGPLEPPIRSSSMSYVEFLIELKTTKHDISQGMYNCSFFLLTNWGINYKKRRREGEARNENGSIGTGE
jgi:hypothetical protein